MKFAKLLLTLATSTIFAQAGGDFCMADLKAESNYEEPLEYEPSLVADFLMDQSYSILTMGKKFTEELCFGLYYDIRQDMCIDLVKGYYTEKDWENESERMLDLLKKNKTLYYYKRSK